MKVEHATESREQYSRRVFHNLVDLGRSVIDMDIENKAPPEVDQQRQGSLENLTSSKRVENWKCIIHHQVLKIREEDSHLGEDIAEGLKEKLAIVSLTSQMDRLNIIARPILPSSPLSGKAAVLN